MEIRNRLLEEQVVEPTEENPLHATTVWRWLRAERLRPGRYHLWQHPKGPERAAPVLALSPRAEPLLREGVWVICSEEKTSIQTLERVHLLKPGEPMRVAAHYLRRGVSPPFDKLRTSLFAGLSGADGQVYGRRRPRKRFEEKSDEEEDFQAFFLETLVPEALTRHVSEIRWILDNGSTHAPAQWAGWLEQQRRKHGWPFTVTVYWLPKYASWLDQIEIWFRILQRKVLTPSHAKKGEDLVNRIMGFIARYKRTATPIRWAYTAEQLQQRLATV